MIASIVINGLVLGGLYALVALGLNLQFGISRILNLAYGATVVLSAFGAYSAHSLALGGPLAALTVILPLAFLLNAAVYRLLMRPLIRRARTPGDLESDSILSTFGLAFVIEGAILAIWGGNLYSYSYLATPLSVGGASLGANRVLAFLVAIVVAIAVYLWLRGTRLGTAVRAMAVNPAAAPLVAIDRERFGLVVFAAGGTLAALAGVLISTFLTFYAAMGVSFTMKALIVVVMGGVGNVAGGLVAGLLLGVVESLTTGLLDASLTLAVNFGLLLLVLLLRPQGLFGGRR